MLRARQHLPKKIAGVLRRADVPQQHTGDADDQRHQRAGLHSLCRADVVPVFAKLHRGEVHEERSAADESSDESEQQHRVRGARVLFMRAGRLELLLVKASHLLVNKV